MQHNGRLFASVRVDILQVELRRQAEIQLTGTQCIFRADGGFHVHVQLRSVESGFADLLGILNAQLVQHFAQCAFRLVPHLVVLVIFHLILRIPQAQHAAVVRDMEVFINIADQVHNAGNLVLDLVGRHKQVRVVLAEMPSAFDALQRTAGLEAEIVRHFADPDRQIPVGVQPVGINHHVVRAVHGAQYKAFAFHFHRREHVFLVMIPVSAGPVKIHRADAGRHHVLIAQHPFLFLDIVFQFHPDRVALRKEHGQSLADQVVRHEQLHFLANLPVIPGFGFLHLALVFLQLVRVPEGNAVQPRQHLVLLVVFPVRAGNRRQFEGFQRLCIAKMRPDAHVDIVALLIEGNHRVLRQVGNMLNLVDFSAVLHQLHRFLPGQRINLERQILLYDLLHFSFNGRQIFVRQMHVSQVDVVMESLLGRGSVGKVCLRIKCAPPSAAAPPALPPPGIPPHVRRCK